MKDSVAARLSHDPLITAVLDQIVNLTHIDSSCIHPDEKLGMALGLGRAQIQEILFEAAKDLHIDVQKENCRVGDMTPREIVGLLDQWLETEDKDSFWMKSAA